MFVILLGVILSATGIEAGRLAIEQTSPPENLQVLGGVPAEQLQQIMDAVGLSLGVECVHCHEPGAFALDDKPEKQTARQMMRMVETLSSTTFEFLEVPSCWTCHRGAVVPESIPPALPFPLDPPAGPFSDSTGASGVVYRNVVTHAQLPANELRDVMGGYTRALGVGCDHCHVPGDWASDANIVKQLTRVMSDMQSDLAPNLVDGPDQVTCWTCHRGEVTPQSNMPPELIPVLAND